MVLYRTRHVDLTSIPEGWPVVLVHNDRDLDPSSISRPGVRHLFAPGNIGFGAGVNLALPELATERVVLCNPDTALAPEHWEALAPAPPHEVRTLPLVDDRGTPTSVVNSYPTPLSHLLTGFRVGRIAPLGSRRRRLLSRASGGYARNNDAGLRLRGGRWPMTSRWASGAVMSVDCRRLAEVEGFDEGYFLYFEDVDLCQRLSERHPDTELVLVPTPPAVHHVGVSARGSRSAVERVRLRSARRYARARPGSAWAITAALLRVRQIWT
jgi:N-acetylglucosaminyl-diphospho-decaprenol L-rhamnosyltransferase